MVMDNSIIPTNSNNNQTNNQQSSNSKAKYFIFAGALALLLLIVGVVAIMASNSSTTSKQAEETLDSIDDKDIAANEIKYIDTKDYTKTLNIYNSIDNGISLDDVKKVITGAGETEAVITIGIEESRINIENGEYISFELIDDEDSNTKVIQNLTYHSLNYGNEETIQQIGGSKFQHYTGTFTNDFDTKEDAIDDYLMRK